ncbi:FAD binding domain-containing protein [Patellaria atrata CBS 101060]|uniref:FAD binding domain-containing protein n=1 Tax=Patellaria atrata CBS 101060 TaxID=1346257 RepID=A0A9P4VM23_9PEZI|nr:FAD binding domain-containing protein [Patellaria atrata CBS 101060]
MASPPKIRQKIERKEEDRLNTLIIGAGLGGLGAAISILLAGHKVQVLESAPQIGEIGAGIQCLPNSSRILFSWGMEEILSAHATRPRRCNMLSWKGKHLAHMDFHDYQQECGTPFWDFHRANLHKCLLDRAVELGAEVRVNARVQNVIVSQDEAAATAILVTGDKLTADLIIGADGINSRCREILLGHPEAPLETGDLAYRLLLSTSAMLQDPELAPLVTDPQVNYWVGPSAHAVNYVLRGGKLFNMVLLVPDDIPPDGPSTLAGNVDEMRALFADWDPRIPKLLALCESVHKWRLCIRPALEPSWSHPSGAFTLLGDAVHATLPYLASGAGMSLEDAEVLGLCLARVERKEVAGKRRALRVYEECRRTRTERVVEAGNRQQTLYHLHDGEEQQRRDVAYAAFQQGGKRAREMGFEEGDDPFPWRWGGCGEWLLRYRCEPHVEGVWAKAVAGEEERAGESKGDGKAMKGVVSERANL